jgi:hypothetical protein
MVLSGWKAEKVSFGCFDYSFSDAKCSCTVRNKVQFWFGVKVTRPTSTVLERILPNVSACRPLPGKEALM